MSGQSIFSVNEGFTSRHSATGYSIPSAYPQTDAATASDAWGANAAQSSAQEPCVPSGELSQQEHHSSPQAKPSSRRSASSTEADVEDFGEILRHELNNPLTGILGNAELLLSEIRRSEDGRLPRGGVQRLETIAALAVRLRETIRRISQEWLIEGSVARKKSES